MCVSLMYCYNIIYIIHYTYGCDSLTAVRVPKNALRRFVRGSGRGLAEERVRSGDRMSEQLRCVEAARDTSGLRAKVTKFSDRSVMSEYRFHSMTSLLMLFLRFHFMTSLLILFQIMLFLRFYFMTSLLMLFQFLFLHVMVPHRLYISGTLGVRIRYTGGT